MFSPDYFDFRRRVHISDKTLAFLNGEFEVEPAFGEKREELLRIAGLKTYFITKVVKPVSKVGCKEVTFRVGGKIIGS